MEWITDPIKQNSDTIIPICLMALVVIALVGLIVYWRRSGMAALAVISTPPQAIDQEALANVIAAATSKAFEKLVPQITGTIEIAGTVEFINELHRGGDDALAKLKQLPEVHRVAAAAYLAERMRTAHAEVSKQMAENLKNGRHPAGDTIKLDQARLDYINTMLEKLASLNENGTTLIKLP